MIVPTQSNLTVFEMPAEELSRRLRTIDVFADLAPADLDWLASRMNVYRLAPDDVLAYEGDPADRMTVVLEGEIRGQKERGQSDGRVYTASAGRVTGMLPYSRLQSYPLTSRAVSTTLIATYPASEFPAMLERMPALGAKLVNVMADRIRETTRADQQRDKLLALGKLSAGLAHEMNNPAAAARRAARDLGETVRAYRLANIKLEQCDLTREQRQYLAEIESNWEKDHQLTALDSLERSDREEEIANFLEGKGVPDAWSFATSLVDAGCDLAQLTELKKHFPMEAMRDVVRRLTASFTMTRLASEIENSTSRIAELVRAVKEYSYMDQMPEQEVDLHDGIETTLVMLRPTLKTGINVKRDYDRTLPKICAYGSELNQVWTNLIENAVDALRLRDEPRNLTIRTVREANNALVEIGDNGPGIPADIKDRIFEPFFTTKPVGQGTGLGLDAVYRIVQKHRGDVSVDSKPGDTRFRVRLPLSKEAIGK